MSRKAILVLQIDAVRQSGDSKLYTENRTRDLALFTKAFLSNQLARFFPKLYVNLTHQTGRGSEGEAIPEIADYFLQCFHDYRANLGLGEDDIDSFLHGKHVMEYGPGDLLGVALLLYAHGAESVHCFDRFELSRMSKKNIDVYRYLLDLLDGKRRERACNAFMEPGKPESGLNNNVISYHVTRDGLSDGMHKYDLIVSRAVLEHVHDLEGTMRDIRQSLKDNGISLHQVDLKSHGLDRYREYDFLTWPTLAYNLMYSHKGFPNRWRVNKYRQLAEQAELCVKNLNPTGCLEQSQAQAIQPYLARELRSVSTDELAWQGFWMHLEHA